MVIILVNYLKLPVYLPNIPSFHFRFMMVDCLFHLHFLHHILKLVIIVNIIIFLITLIQVEYLTTVVLPSPHILYHRFKIMVVIMMVKYLLDSVFSQLILLYHFMIMVVEFMFN